MDRFHEIQDAAAIVTSKGVYRQVKIYRRGTALYVGYGAGFVRLLENHGTGVPTLRWDEIDVGLEYKRDNLGKLALTAPAMRAIEGPAE
jgi:hypothetical protein